MKSIRSFSLGYGFLAFCLTAVWGSSGITPPIEFHDLDADQWRIDISVHRDDIKNLTITREIYHQGSLIRVIPEQVNYQYGVTASFSLDLDFEGKTLLPDGAYSQELIASGVPVQEGDVPFFTSHSVHFLIQNGRMSFVSQSEYSQITDPTFELMMNGKVVRFHSGQATDVRFSEKGGLPTGEDVLVLSGHQPGKKKDLSEEDEP